MSWGFVDDDPASFLPSEIPHFNKTMEYHIKNIPEKPWFFKSVHDEFNYIIKNVKLNSKYLDQYIRIDVILAFYNIVIKDCYHYEDIMEGFERFQKSFRDTNPCLLYTSDAADE